MFRKEAKGTDYSKIDTDCAFSQLVIHVRVKAGQTLKLRIRSKWFMTDWGEGELNKEREHTYTESGLQNINIVGSRINWLNVEGWNATQIYIDRCPYLARLCCRGNRLTKLNLMNCPALVYVDCSYNKLDYIQVANLKKLKEIKANSNYLKVVDLSGCSQLKKVDLNNNGLFIAITRECKKLKSLWFEDKEFTPEEYKEEIDDLPALIINDGGEVTVKGDRELVERGQRIIKELKAEYKKS